MGNTGSAVNTNMPSVKEFIISETSSHQVGCLCEMRRTCPFVHCFLQQMLLMIAFRSSKKVVVFSKTYCSYCKKTKQLFSGMKGIDVVVHELDTLPNGQAVQDELLTLTGQQTVPNVWVGGSFLGGNDVTHAAASSGKLKQMLGK